jgi:signal recognition particle receptor subunit beta
LLLQGERTRTDVKEIVHKFGHPGVSIKIVNKGDLASQLVDSKYQDLIERLDRFTILQEFLAFSSVNVSELLSWLYHLKEENFLEIRDDSGIDIESLSVVDEQKTSGLGEKLLEAKEVKNLREILDAEDISTGKLLVLGTNSMTNADFIHVFNQGNLTPVRTSHNLDYTKIELDDYFTLNVFGISLSKEVNETIDKLSAGLLGYVILIDNQNPEHFEYANYVMNNLSKLYSVPWTVALTNLDENQKISEDVKKSLKIPGDRELIPLDVSQKEDVKNIILSIH